MSGSNRPGGGDASAAAASAASSVAQPPAFRGDADASSFPIGGAVMLLVLLAVAAWAWTAGRKGGSRLGRPSSSRRWPFPLAPAANASSMKVVASARLDVGGRAHVVEWGGQQVLIAINGTGAPVVLARRRLADAARELEP